jgi:hypothetical protein
LTSCQVRFKYQVIIAAAAPLSFTLPAALHAWALAAAPPTRAALLALALQQLLVVVVPSLAVYFWEALMRRRFLQQAVRGELKAPGARVTGLAAAGPADELLQEEAVAGGSGTRQGTGALRARRPPTQRPPALPEGEGGGP